MEFITVTDKPEFKDCWGCSNCSSACPVSAIEPKVAHFDNLLAAGASAAASTFKKAYYVTLLKNITQLCDCCSSPGEIIAPDCGVLASASAAAIDKASYDIVTAAAGKDVFLEHNKKTGLGQVRFAERYSPLGKSDYEIIEV